MKRPDSKYVMHHAHTTVHLAYLVLVSFHSTYYPIAAGILAVVIIVGEVVDKLKYKD